MSKPAHWRYIRYGSKFYNRNGDLTAYSLACGYVQESGRARLYYDGGTVYHVRHESGIWDVFETLTAARKRFREVSRITDD